MATDSLAFEALFVGQLVGSLLLVAGLFLGDLTTLTIVGGAIVLACVAGLAMAALAAERDGPSIADPDADGSAPGTGRAAK